MIKLPTLSGREIRMAGFHAIDRRSHHLVSGMSDYSEQPHYPWDHEVQSILAEVSFSKWRDLYWTGVTNNGSPDCGGYEVRWTEHQENGGAFVYSRNKADRLMAVVVGFDAQFFAVGWTIAKYGRRDEWAYGRSGKKWLVPREHLMPFGVDFDCN